MTVKITYNNHTEHAPNYREAMKMLWCMGINNAVIEDSSNNKRYVLKPEEDIWQVSG